MTKIRLPHDANTKLDVIQYFNTRDRQLRSEHCAYVLTDTFKWYPEGCTVRLKDMTNDRDYASFYVYASARGSTAGITLVNRLLEENPDTIILTVYDCSILDWLIYKAITFEICYGWFDTTEYEAIQTVYGDQCAKRSGVFLMNHIDEGIHIGSLIEASSSTIRAYCLHPLVQNDRELSQYFQVAIDAASGADNTTEKVIALMMEYRYQANSWLSDKVSVVNGNIVYSGSPTPGPLKEVAEMLIMDKVQNYKDFCLYHKGTHPRSVELDAYFHRWFDALGLTTEKVDSMIAEISRSEWDFQKIIL